jgi:hypothetical protein
MLRIERMPDVTNDERGRRIFQLHKERAVETALEKVRQNPKSEWSAFSPEDIRTLNQILGEAWVSVERRIWEQSAFTRLTRKHLEEIIGIGNDVKNKKIREEDAVNKICRILKGSI